MPDAFFPFTDLQETVARVLDEATFDRGRAEGSAMSIEVARVYAAREGVDSIRTPSGDSG